DDAPSTDGAATDEAPTTETDEASVDPTAAETEDDGVRVRAVLVDDAIQDALMSGKCYEPGDGVLKPI
ncbi:hypothetical protein EXE53_24930, partial [Halorubrum sp. SD626R]